jgi:ankyrin repeat protein
MNHTLSHRGRTLANVLILLAGLWCASVQAGAFEDFFLAIKNDNAAAIKSLLDRGMDPNTIDPDGEPALIRGLRENAFAVFDVLLARPDIDVNRQNSVAENAIMVAAFRGRLDLVRKLLDREAEVNKTGWTALHYAAAVGNNDIVALLLDKSAYIDAESPNHTTPLMMAARGGHIRTVKLLLDEGADSSVKNEQGMTVLEFAERHGQTEIVEGLKARARRDVERRLKPWK